MVTQLSFPSLLLLIGTGSVVAIVLWSQLSSASFSPDEFARAIHACAEKEKGHQECYDELATRLSREDVAAQHTLIDAALGDPEFSKMCHKVSHYLGASFFRSSRSLPEALGMCSPACSAGCYHGVAEAYFTHAVSSGILKESSFLEEIARMSCPVGLDCEKHFGDVLHGVGHALMGLNNNDLPRSLTLCNTLQSPGGCYAGVFMSNYMALEDNVHPSEFIDASDPLFPCTVLSPTYAESCYTNQADFFLSGTVAENAKICATFPDSMKSICFRRVANHSFHSVTAPHELVSLCSPLKNEEYGLCIENIVDRLSERKSSPQDDVQAFCEAVTEPLRARCFSRADYKKARPVDPRP